MPMSEERVLTVPEVAKRMQVRPEAVRRWIREGKITAWLPGGTKTGYRVLESELERFISAGRKQAS
jgi:excisionase family DNA binding protein